jgi:hypothetical protein
MVLQSESKPVLPRQGANSRYIILSLPFKEIESEFLFFKSTFDILNWDIFPIRREPRGAVEPNESSERPSISDYIRLGECQMVASAMRE